MLVCQMCQEKALKFCLDIINNGAFLFDLACPKHLSVQSPANLPYIKLVEFIVIQVIGVLKNECCLSRFTFKKIKLRNKLTTHLELIIHMFNHKFFTLQDFPFGTIIPNWKHNRIQYEVWRLPKFHIFFLCILYHDFLNLNIFLFFWAIWLDIEMFGKLEVGHLVYLLQLASLFLLAHQNLELLSSITLLQKFVKFFYEALIQWFIVLNLWHYFGYDLWATYGRN